jgi:hypothetical protein
MVSIYPPPKYFKDEYQLLDLCELHCDEYGKDYYLLPDHNMFLDGQKYKIQRCFVVSGWVRAYIAKQDGTEVQCLGKTKGLLNAYKLIYKHFLTLL